MDKKKKIILLITIIACAAVIGVAAALIFRSLGNGDVFKNGASCGAKTKEPQKNVETTEFPATEEPSDIIITTSEPKPTPDTPDETPYAGEIATPTPTPTPTPIDPYEELIEKADTSMMKNIVNILLIGVDYSTERETWNGKKEWHSDVMMVLAVNFDENRADLISLPRDTYAKIPGVKGIYKLNASLNCGGGLYNDDGTVNPKGLEKVCEAAEWMLGGIDVDYYYAVTMTSLKELVDLCGGLEYDMDIKFHIQGRSYEKGLQHINGQAFLDYCRVRKAENGLTAAETNDARRVDRQKRMLIALFKQMKADQLITKIPNIIDTFDGDLFTNCTFAQTAALAAFAYNLDPANIGMYSMSGTTKTMFHWNFCFTNQSNRVGIIKQVYGVDVKSYGEYTETYGRYHWCDLLYDHYKELYDPLTKYVQKLIDEDDKLPEFTPEPTEEPTPDPTPTKKPDKTTPTPDPTPTKKPEKTTPTPTADPTPTKKPEESTPTPDPTPTPTANPTPTPTSDPTPTPDPTPTKQPEEPEPTDSGEDGNALQPVSDLQRSILYKTDEAQVRKYTAEQRELFEQYKTAVKELEEIHKEADKQAKKSKTGKALSEIADTYLKKLAEVQELAIKVAIEFEYTKVKNFTVPCAPTATANSSSPWSFRYWTDRKFNEIRVDFN